MKDRCINENNKFYYRYGGRGLFVCNEWTNDFVTFYNWSVSNGWIQGLSIERRDNDRGYSPDNCYWATPKQQSRNTSRNVIFNNELAVDATKRLGGNSALIARRLHDGWTLEKAFTTPVGKYTRT